MGKLTKQAISDAIKRFRPTPVEIPELGVTFHVLPCTLPQVRKFQEAEEKSDVGQLLMLATCICDEDGQRLYADDELDAVGEIPFFAHSRLIKAINAVSGLGDEGMANAEGN